VKIQHPKHNSEIGWKQLSCLVATTLLYIKRRGKMGYLNDKIQEPNYDKWEAKKLHYYVVAVTLDETRH
jgi:hypothetical protein